MTMTINIKRFELALEKRSNERAPSSPAGPLVVVPVAPETTSFFEKYLVPESLRQFLTAHAYRHPVTLGHLVFDAVDEMPKENLDEVNARCIEDALLIVGSGLNGDPIVLDLRNGLRVGYVNTIHSGSSKTTGMRVCLYEIFSSTRGSTSARSTWRLASTRTPSPPTRMMPRSWTRRRCASSPIRPSLRANQELLHVDLVEAQRALSAMPPEQRVRTSAGSLVP
jgi:hypothetical protein